MIPSKVISTDKKNIFKVGNIVKNIAAMMSLRHTALLEESKAVTPRAPMKKVFLKIS